jgi:hypothetical protein
MAPSLVAMSRVIFPRPGSSSLSSGVFAAMVRASQYRKRTRAHVFRPVGIIPFIIYGTGGLVGGYVTKELKRPSVTAPDKGHRRRRALEGLSGVMRDDEHKGPTGLDIVGRRTMEDLEARPTELLGSSPSDVRESELSPEIRVDASALECEEHKTSNATSSKGLLSPITELKSSEETDTTPRAIRIRSQTYIPRSGYQPSPLVTMTSDMTPHMEEISSSSEQEDSQGNHPFTDSARVVRSSIDSIPTPLQITLKSQFFDEKEHERGTAIICTTLSCTQRFTCSVYVSCARTCDKLQHQLNA